MTCQLHQVPLPTKKDCKDGLHQLCEIQLVHPVLVFYTTLAQLHHTTLPGFIVWWRLSYALQYFSCFVVWLAEQLHPLPILEMYQRKICAVLYYGNYPLFMGHRENYNLIDTQREYWQQLKRNVATEYQGIIFFASLCTPHSR